MRNLPAACFPASHKLMTTRITSFAICLILSCMPGPVFSADNGPPLKARWSINMGQSGLRRFFATGGELGELINRQVSYQTANRLQSRQGSNPSPDLPRADHSDVLGYVAQSDSLFPVSVNEERLLFIRTLARGARRYEKDKLHSGNDRLDLGLVLAPSARSFASLGIAIEKTRADIKYVTGSTELTGRGPRLDIGVQVKPGLAVGLRAEDLKFTGDNSVSITSPTALLNIRRDIEFHRRFVHLETLLRLDRSRLSWLPAGMQLGAMAGLQYLENDYTSQSNNLGQPVVEPFGNRQRLGIFRTGLYFSSPLGSDTGWTFSTDLMVDHEVSSNMDSPIGQPGSVLPRLAIAKVLGPGKRITFEYQRSQNFGLTRERNNFVLTAVIDF